MHLLSVERLTKSFDRGKTRTLDEISFTVEKGTVLAIVGESGSGKTTLIRLISGLETPDSGVIQLQDHVISSIDTMIPPEKRRIGMVFQEYALFPHLSVSDNIAYGIVGVQHKKKRVAEVLQLVGLEGFEKRYPHQLSGGQQQRVALARAIAPNPDLLILDEPFSNLDTVLREQLRRELFDIIEKTKITVIFVTHDTEDALSVSDQILVLRQGKLMQKGDATTLFQSPTSAYVASLFSPVIQFTESQLKLFGISIVEQHTCVIRTHRLQVNQKTTYTTKGNVVKSVFMGDHYQIQVALLDQSKMVVYDTKEHSNIIEIGVMEEDLLRF